MINQLRNQYLGRIYYHANKLKSIEYKGGKCIKCGENNIFKLCFHHVSIKEHKIPDLFHGRWDILKKEIDLCELLCFNCHMEYHYGDNIRNEKKILLEFKNKLSCENCGYDKCTASLDFHHINSKDKNFKMSSIMHLKDINVQLLKDHIESELNKCVILCSNCHNYLHSDIKFFEENKTEIYDKINNKRYKQPKLDREKILQLYNEGMKQVDISKHFNTSKSTISSIIKKFK